MCGICGIIDYNRSADINEMMLRRMCEELKHRGPDDEGVFLNRDTPSIGLGHRRLSIIDLSEAGHQPMCNEDGTLWAVLNGEIYNFQELREVLEKKGHRFKSHTDTETLIHLYENYGEDCVKYLRGMFAFAIWDERKKILFLARDRVGKKPLLYYYKDNRFCFASEFTSILASNLIDKEINFQAIDHYLSFGYIPSPLTIYKHVFKLPAAHSLLLKDNQLSLEKYWELDYSPKINISEQEASEEILRLLKEAVKIRLYSDVPLGAFLSGGIDSSTVVALMSELSRNKVKTFSIGFAEKDYSELKFAKNIAARFNTEHHEFMVKPKALKILPLLIERYGEPYADSSCIPSYYVSQQTRQYVTVALNGDGGDESFAGYERYQAMLIADIYYNLPNIAKKTLRILTERLPDSTNPKNSLRRVKRFFDGAALPVERRYLRWVGIFDDTLKQALYSEAFQDKTQGEDSIQWIASYMDSNPTSHIIDRLLNTDVHTYLPYDLLVKMDIASMANSLEARSPFLDQKLMEFAARLPAHYKMRRLVKKYILKKAVKDLIPQENIYRRKMGFGIPVGEWFRNELKGFLQETLVSQISLGRGYFKPEVVKYMVNAHIAGQKDYTYRLWALLMLELWHKRFID